MSRGGRGGDPAIIGSSDVRHRPLTLPLSPHFVLSYQDTNRPVEQKEEEEEDNKRGEKGDGQAMGGRQPNSRSHVDAEDFRTHFQRPVKFDN